jgi:hypothetical protein
VSKEELSNSEWLIDIYSNILKMEVDSSDQGHKYWMNELNNGKSREQIENYFKQTAKKENKDLFKKSLKEQIDFDRDTTRIAYVMPDHSEDVLMSTSVVASLKRLYKDSDIYFFTKREHFGLIDECPDIYKMCEFQEEMDDCFYFEGRANQEGLFDLAFLPFLETKHVLNYTHNGNDKIELELV